MHATGECVIIFLLIFLLSFGEGRQGERLSFSLCLPRGAGFIALPPPPRVHTCTVLKGPAM
jgi:hypothetical protein